ALTNGSFGRGHPHMKRPAASYATTPVAHFTTKPYPSTRIWSPTPLATVSPVFRSKTANVPSPATPTDAGPSERPLTAPRSFRRQTHRARAPPPAGTYASTFSPLDRITMPA